MKTYHLKPREDRWDLSGEDGKPLGSYTTKWEAVARSAELTPGRSGSLQIHKADGTIEEVRPLPGPFHH